MELEPFADSEKGAKAAWNGFTSQTLYIANRLMLLNDESEFSPEKVEDLLVSDNGIPLESIQVKNITADLTLSHFSPQKPDSFFRRSLALRKENEKLKISIISFGPLGKELIDITENNKKTIGTIVNRLVGYDYLLADAEWLLSHLEIQIVDYDDLEKQIFNELNKITETMAAPALAFDVLISYISNLSQKGGKTSKFDWEKKLHDIATDFAAMSGFQQEYGRSLRPLFEYKSGLTSEKLGEGYRMGINAHPDHIRNKLDLRREKWIERIKNGFSDNQIVILRGASGQGKSSLAFRYLIDTYPESNVFLIEQIENKTQAANILAALSNLSATRDNNLIAYIDVAPYEKDWLWIVGQLQKTGRNLKLLITIREEDYRRTVVDKSDISFDDIEMLFDKSEAEWIYSQQDAKRFRNFEEAWLMFGESGPLMEFIYLINETSTLKQKLEAQINRIRMEEIEAQTWLSVLRLSAYAGRLNINLNLTKVIQATECRNYDKMIYLFEKEYLLRETENKIYIEPLHAIRAEIIYSILKDLGLYPEEDLLLSAIKCVDDHSQMLIVNHCYSNQYSLDLIENIAMLSFDKWSNYASTVNGILWIEVYNLYQLDREVLLEGDKVSSNAFGFLALPDVSGLLGEVELSSFFEILQKTNPQRFELFKEIFGRIPQKHLEYSFIDRFFELSKGTLPSYLPDKNHEISDLGFVLFWLSIRGFLISPFFDMNKVVQLIGVADIDNMLDLTEGIYYQKWHGIYSAVLPIMRDCVCSKFRVIVLEEADNNISSQFIVDVFNDDIKNSRYSPHARTMAVVQAFRKLYPGKQRYAVKILGADFMDGIPVLDGEKNIDARYLPSEYITQLNGWFHNLNIYDHRVGTWNEYVENIIDVRNSIVDSAQALLEGIGYLYKKNGNLKKLTDENISKLIAETEKKILNDHSILPKFTMDRFGFSKESYETNKNDDDKKDVGIQVAQNSQSAPGAMAGVVTLFFRKAFRDYCTHFSNFLQQKDDLIVSRIQGATENHKGDLSTINLIDAVSQIKVIQMEFEKLFSDLTDQNEISQLRIKEDESLELLLNVWKFLEKTNVQKIDSVVYGQKNLIRKEKHEIEWFFTKKLETLVGVKSISLPTLQTDGKVNLYLTVDIEKMDVFLSILYKEFKNTFPKAEPLTAESLHILNYVSHLIVCPSMESYQILAAMSVDVRNFINCDEEKFTKYVTPYEPDGYIKDHFIIPSEGDRIFNWNSLRSYVIVLRLLLSHADKIINTMFSMPPDTKIEDKIFYKWCDDGGVLFSKIMGQISVDFQFLADKLNQEPNAKEYLNALAQTISALKENKEMFIKSPDKSQFLGLLENFNNNLGHLFPYVAQ